MGGALVTQLNRDTLKFAMKCSHITCDSKSVEVFKDPVTDHGKKSKAGRLDLVKLVDGTFSTIKLSDNQISNDFSIMHTVYENGDLLIDENFEEIRNRTKTW